MKTSIFLLCLALLASTSLAWNIRVNNGDDQKVKIDFFYESLCPYCQQFMAGALKTAANTKVSIKLLRISGKSVTSL